MSEKKNLGEQKPFSKFVLEVDCLRGRSIDLRLLQESFGRSLDIVGMNFINNLR